MAHVAWDYGGVADNASDTGTGQDHETTGAPSSDETGGETTQQAKPAGRRSGGMRDMLLSMIVLAAVVLILAGLTKGCSFSPGGPSTNSSLLPAVDVSAELRAALPQVKIPLRQMQPPAGWRANSASVDQLGSNDEAVRIGWITPEGHFLQISQSDATALALVRSAANVSNDTPVSATGSETVDGTKWTVYPGVRSESSWVADLGTARVFITGNGTTNEFRSLADATLHGKPVQAGGS